MFKKIAALLLILFSTTMTKEAFASLDVVYPTSANSVINASNTFVFGQTDTGAKLYINSKPVDLWENCFFVYVVPLNYGKNEILFTSILNGVRTDKVYTVTRKGSPSTVSNRIVTQPGVKTSSTNVPGVIDFKDTYYTKTINKNSTVRDNPSKYANRITELPPGVVLYLSGRKGEYYRIDESDGSTYWIHKSNIQQPVCVNEKMTPVLKDFKYYRDDKYDYFKFYLSHPVMYKVTQSGKTIYLTLFGVKNEKGNNHIHTFNFNMPVMGYECYYEDNNLIFKKVKNPNVRHEKRPLDGIKIFVDAGHGGEEKGAIGPTRIYEKDINLSIANKLINLLQNDGATVSYTRTDDRKVPLYERVELARKNDALISISIHNNSLPNGKNPYYTHGTEVHYYNENAENLAQIINNNLSKDLCLYNNGVHRTSLALDRATNPVSILIEVAYMINPDEYIMLRNDNFRQKAAESIEKSLKEYILQIKN